MAGLADNIDLLRMLGAEVPRIRLRKRIARAGGTALHEITIAGARPYVDPSVHGLLDGADVRVAVAFPAGARAAVAVVGPAPRNALRALLEGLPDDPKAREVDPYQILAVTSRVDPSAVGPAVGPAPTLDPLALLSAPRVSRPTHVSVRRTDTTLHLAVRFPPPLARAALALPAGAPSGAN